MTQSGWCGPRAQPENATSTAVSAIATTRQSAIPVRPDVTAVRKQIKKRPRAAPWAARPNESEHRARAKRQDADFTRRNPCASARAGPPGHARRSKSLHAILCASQSSGERGGWFGGGLVGVACVPCGSGLACVPEELSWGAGAAWDGWLICGG